MDKAKQRIAIAEACGWTDIKRINVGEYGGLRGISPKGYFVIIPSYLTCLNAMHEAEEILKGIPGFDWPQYGEYCRKIYDICKRDDTQPYSATAPQRAEAFLQVLGLWEETA